MERQRFLPLLAVIIFIWALWRYEAALALLGFFCNLIMPFIIGGCLAFIVNVPLVHIERLWQNCLHAFLQTGPKNQTSGLSDLHPDSYYWHRSDRRAQNWPRSAPKL